MNRAPTKPEPDELMRRHTIDPGICRGQPCIRHMRIRVSDVLEMLAGGASEQEILEDYPYLEREDLRACHRGEDLVRITASS